MKSSEPYKRPLLSTKALTVVCPTAILGIIVWRAEPKDLPEMLKIIMSSRILPITLLAILVVVLLVAFVTIRFLQKTHDKEISRLARERDRLQDKLSERSETPHDK
jgi:phosphotransferase system  glucose/maltose/N-acetylglucosamine-specific IIC component